MEETTKISLKKLFRFIKIYFFSVFSIKLIVGEVYDVDSKMLEKLDELEEHPEFYVRTEENVLLATENSNDSFDEVPTKQNNNNNIKLNLNTKKYC